MSNQRYPEEFKIEAVKHADSTLTRTPIPRTSGQ